MGDLIEEYAEIIQALIMGGSMVMVFLSIILKVM